MGKIQKAIEAIYNAKNSRGEINQIKIATLTGYSKGQVNHLITGARRLNEDSLLAIMDAIGITFSDLDTAIRGANRFDDALTGLADSYSNLSGTDKELVKSLIDSLAQKPTAAAPSTPAAPVIEEPDEEPLPPMEEEAREAEDEYEEEDLLRVRYFEDIAAGVPYSVEPPLNLYIDVPRSKLPGGRVKDSWYALRVTGDSMEPKLHSGDIVLMDSNLEPMNGKIVAALIDDEDNTLKVFKYKSGEVTLVPFNPAYAPTTYRADRITVQGVLVDVVRRVGAKR